MEKRNLFTVLHDSINLLTNADSSKAQSVKYIQTSEIEITSPENKEINVDIDGEYFGSLPIKITVCPQAISLLVP